MGRTRIVAALATAAAITLLAGCAGTPAATTAADKTQAVRMATMPWIGYGPWYIAETDGIFADAGLTVEQTEFEGDAEVNAAFISGNVDVANVATHTAMLMKQAGVPIKIVLIEDVSTTADAIIAPAGIESIADLAGKKVAYEQGTTSDLLLNYALEDAGMTLDDIVAVPMNAADAGVALIGGKVDAAVTYEPYIQTALAEDADLGVLFSADELPGLISDVLVVSDDFIAEHPDTIQALVSSWGLALDSYNADQTAGRAIIADAVGEDAEALASAFDGVIFYDGAQNAEELGGSFLSDAMPLVLKAAQAAGIVSGDVDLSALVDPQFVAN